MNAHATFGARYARALALLACAALLALSLAGCGSAAATGSSSGAAVQHFDVDLSSGTYAPNQITAKAGTPVQITFGQGAGCIQRLEFPSFKIDADLSGGPQTFDLGSLQPGEYTWSCGMNMQHGVLKVE